MQKKDWVVDIETNRLENPDRIWCVVCRSLDNDIKIFEEDWDEFNRFIDEDVNLIVGHNFLGFDLHHLNSLVCTKPIDPSRVVDTLVLSRLFRPKREGGHSLEAWGARVGAKKEHADLTSEDFALYNPKVLERCISDTLVNLKIYEGFLKYINNPRFSKAIELEHQMALICHDLHKQGFPFDRKKALELKAYVVKRMIEIDDNLQNAFPPRPVLKKILAPRFTSDGVLFKADARQLEDAGYDLSKIVPNQTYDIFEDEVFNPASIKQIIDRLTEAGWKPVEKTKGHIDATKRGSDVSPEKLEHFKRYGWRICPENLATLPKDAPEAAQSLVERILLASRNSDLDEYLGLCRLDSDNVWRIHGRFTSIGAWTQRMSTNSPNMQNIPSPTDFGNPSLSRLQTLSNQINYKMRSCWVAEKGKIIVGTDADGIQMRIFAHYVNDPKLTEALVNGDKKLGTDIHSVHQRALGEVCNTRDKAKTFIYAWLLGAGIGKVAQILECSQSQAREAVDQFIAFYPGLQKLKAERIPIDADRGYFEGLDGRLVICDDEHRMLGGYLQNGEQIIMKRANVKWRQQCDRINLPYWQINFIHDEWQTMTWNIPEIYQQLSEMQIQAIRDQADELELNCPLDGQSNFGFSWMETH